MQTPKEWMKYINNIDQSIQGLQLLKQKALRQLEASSKESLEEKLS